MTGLEELLKFIREQSAEIERMKNSDDKFDQLYYRLVYNRTKECQELLKLRDEVIEFLHGNYPEEQKEKIRGYTEMLYMSLSACERTKNK